MEKTKIIYNRLIMIGAFPPPVHGMAAVNKAVYDQFVDIKAKPIVINIAAKSLDRSLVTRICRSSKILRSLSIILFRRNWKKCVLYMSVSGGFGQVYELLFLLLARQRKMRIYLHHHSFAYIDRLSRITRLLMAIAGPDCVHITLSIGMASRLQSQYSSVRHVVPISNAVFYSKNRSSSNDKHTYLNTIGFISNISQEKGIFDFLDLVAACEAKGIPIKALIAGPCQDVETEGMLNQRISELTTVEYVGPKYGTDKESFFRAIDSLIFPTRYVNEAEPLTIHEAMQHALPVIAYGRGCIPELVCQECGLVIDPAVPFVTSALKQIQGWVDYPENYKMASNSAAKHFEYILVENCHRWHDLRTEIIAKNTTDDSNSVSKLEKKPSHS